MRREIRATQQITTLVRHPSHLSQMNDRARSQTRGGRRQSKDRVTGRVHNPFSGRANEIEFIFVRKSNVVQRTMPMQKKKRSNYQKMTSICGTGMSTTSSNSTISSRTCGIGTSMICSAIRSNSVSAIGFNVPQYRTRRATLRNVSSLRSAQVSSFVYV